MFSKWVPLVFVLLVLGSGMLMFGCKGCNHGKAPVKDTADTSGAPNNVLIKSLTDKIHADPTNAENYFLRSNAYLASNAIKIAYRDMGKALELDSTQAKYFLGVTDIYMRGGYAAGANDALVKLLRRQPDNTDAMNRLSKVYFYQKNYESSLTQVTNLLKKQPDNAEAYFIMGMNLKEMKDTVKAINAFQKAVQKKQNFYDAYIQLGLLHAQIKSNIAPQYFDNAIRIDSTDPQAWYGKAMYYQNTGFSALNKHNKSAAANNLEAAKATYRELIAKNPHYENAFFNLGFIYLQQDSIDNAYKYFDFAIKMKPQYTEAYYYRALCEEQKGEIDKAKTDLINALSLRNDYPLAQTELDNLNKKK